MSRLSFDGLNYFGIGADQIQLQGPVAFSDIEGSFEFPNNGTGPSGYLVSNSEAEQSIPTSWSGARVVADGGDFVVYKINNDVHFRWQPSADMKNALAATATGAFLTPAILEEKFRPTTGALFPIIVNQNNVNQIGYIQISSVGTLTVQNAGTPFTLGQVASVFSDISGVYNTLL